MLNLKNISEEYLNDSSQWDCTPFLIYRESLKEMGYMPFPQLTAFFGVVCTSGAVANILIVLAFLKERLILNLKALF